MVISVMKENDIRLNVTINTKIGSVRHPRPCKIPKYFFDGKTKKIVTLLSTSQFAKTAAAEFSTERKCPIILKGVF